MLLEATSPLTTCRDVDAAVEIMAAHDSVMSVVSCPKAFYWNEDGTPANYGTRQRPLRHDIKPLFQENGAVYVGNAGRIMSGAPRVYGDVGLKVMPEDTKYEIDTPEDWDIVEKLLEARLS